MSYIEYVTGDYDKRDPLEDLGRANGFTTVDLEKNRNGKISDRQVGRLWSKALKPINYPAKALIGWLIFCFCIHTLVPGVVLAIMAMFSGKAVAAVFGAVTVAALGALLLALFKSGRSMVLLIRDLSAGKAAHIEGRVSPSWEQKDGLGLDTMRKEKQGQYWYVVRNEYFEVEEEGFKALVPGIYRLYYTPSSKLLLSLEPGNGKS